MKQLSYLLLSILLINACTNDKYNYQLEEEILKCYYAENRAQGIDAEMYFDEIEAVFIHFQVLKDKSGESYIAAIEKMRDSADVILENIKLKKVIRKIEFIPPIIRCKNIFFGTTDTTVINQSRLKYSMDFFNTIYFKGDITPEIIAAEILAYYTAEDFEQDYYSHFFLTSVASLFDIREVSPARIMQSKQPSGPNSLSISVTEDSEILIGKEYIKAEEIAKIKSITKKFLLSTARTVDFKNVDIKMTFTGNVYFGQLGETNYKMYLAVYNEIKAAYDELKNEHSNKFFGKNIDELNIKERQIIKLIIQGEIIEMEAAISGSSN